MKKTYVIDTNILIQAPHAFLCFEENDVVLPLVVVEELDGLKKADGEKGSNARKVVRMLEQYRNVEVEAKRPEKADFFTNWEKAAPRIYCELIHAKKNRTLLLEVPHKKFLDPPKCAPPCF